MSNSEMYNQRSMILQYLRTHGSITPKDAENELGCMRLGARIWELRESGYNITKTMEKGLNLFGKPVRFARYTLIE